MLPPVRARTRRPGRGAPRTPSRLAGRPPLAPTLRARHALLRQGAPLMDRILELLARLNDLSADERAELRGLITESAPALAGEARPPEVVEALGSLADGLDSLTAREAVIAEEQAALDTAADAALARLNPVEPESTI